MILRKDLTAITSYLYQTQTNNQLFDELWIVLKNNGSHRLCEIHGLSEEQLTAIEEIKKQK